MTQADTDKSRDDKLGETISKLLGVPLAVARTITQANMMEGMIDAYIADFYTRCPAADYKASYLAVRWDILANRNVTLNAKIDILFKVFKRIDPAHATSTYRKKYVTWLEIRNKFAHSQQVGSSDGDKLFYGGEFLDAEALANDFMTYQQEIMIHMDKYAELKGPYFNHIPTKEWENHE